MCTACVGTILGGKCRVFEFAMAMRMCSGTVVCCLKTSDFCEPNCIIYKYKTQLENVVSYCALHTFRAVGEEGKCVCAVFVGTLSNSCP